MNVTAVVRDLEPKPPVLEFIPDGVEVIVSNWKAPDFKGDASNTVESMAVARNDGAMKATGDILVFLDGDVKFSETFFWNTVNRCKEGTVVGLENPYHRFAQGSYIVIHRNDFFRAGGVDPHMFYHEDIAFSYKLESMGLTLDLYDINNIKLLDRSPTRFCPSFLKHFRIQLILALLYPKLHLKKLLRTGIFDYFYHKYVTDRKQKKTGERVGKI
jgi:glycosyltransferase involved in cell wall biosynthesis